MVDEHYSRSHDVSGDLKRAYPKFPEWFKHKTPRFALLSLTTSRLRPFSIYGDEGLMASPKDLFSKEEAIAYLEGAKEIMRFSKRLYWELGPK